MYWKIDYLMVLKHVNMTKWLQNKSEWERERDLILCIWFQELISDHINRVNFFCLA